MRTKNGFTLIEVLVTVMIIGILAGAAYGSYAWISDRAKAVEAREILLKCYRGYRVLIAEKEDTSLASLTWKRLGMSDPTTAPGARFGYSIIGCGPNSCVRAVMNTDASRWLEIQLASGDITTSDPLL